LLLPIAIRFNLVDEGRSLLTPMAAKVALAVSVQIQAADPSSGSLGISSFKGSSDILHAFLGMRSLLPRPPLILHPF
jgi:hypothetical protein